MNDQGGNGGGKALATAPRSKYETMLENGTDMIRRVAGPNADVNRLKKLAVMAVLESKDLGDAAGKSPISFLMSVCQVASLRLDISRAMQRAFLIPYNGVVTMQLGWRGLIELAYREPRVEAIDAQPVYEGEPFKLEVGKMPQHERKLQHGPLVGWYAYAKLRDSDVVLVEPFTLEEAKALKARSHSKAWNTDFAEMGRKGPIKRLCKRLPSSTDNDLARGLAMDEDKVETGEPAYPSAADLLNAPLGPTTVESVPEEPRGELTEGQREFAENAAFDADDIASQMKELDDH